MPLVAAALTFGSFGDILEAAKIAKRIIDVLRRGGGSCERLRLISTLQHICDYMSQLTVLPDASLTTRLRDQVGLCCSLLDQFHKKIKSQESFLGRRWMVALEERELTSWRVQISEHRDALRGLLGPITILQLHDVGEQLGRVGSQVQYVGSRIDNVKAHIQHEVGTLGVLIETHLSAATSRMGSGIRGVATDIQTVQQAIHKILPRNISDPFFYVRSPLGHPFRFPPIRVLMILRAYCSRPDAGSRYIERGDYSIVSTAGAIIPRLRLRGELKAGIEFDMSIIQRTHLRPAPQECHHCGHTNVDAVEATWVNCSECGMKYQVSKGIEDIYSPQTSRPHRAEPDCEEGQTESFRLVQIFYVSVHRRKRGARKGKGKGASQSPLSPKDETIESLAAASQALAAEISSLTAAQARRPSNRPSCLQTNSR